MFKNIAGQGDMAMWGTCQNQRNANRLVLHVTALILFRYLFPPPGNPIGRPARHWRVKLDDYWKGTIWQRIVQDRQMWKQQAEAFAQPQDTMAAQ